MNYGGKKLTFLDGPTHPLYTSDQVYMVQNMLMLTSLWLHRIFLQGMVYESHQHNTNHVGIPTANYDSLLLMVQWALYSILLILVLEWTKHADNKRLIRRMILV
jgi:hypothetical protein